MVRAKVLEVEWNFQSWSFWIEFNSQSSLVSKGLAFVWTGAKGVHLCPVSLSNVN